MVSPPSSLQILVLYLPFVVLCFLAYTAKVSLLWNSDACTVFRLLFVFRYYRLIVGILGWLRSRPIPVPMVTTLTSNDVTVIVPTVAPYGSEFIECLESICWNFPREIHVIIPSSRLTTYAKLVCDKLASHYKILIRVMVSDVANKRKQVCCGLKRVETKIVATADDHVFWPAGFLNHTLAPFENDKVAAVGTTKRVRRNWKGNFVDDFFNFLGCLYLERHNFEILSTNAIDGGVFVVSGRTALYRTSVVQDPEFLMRFVNEHFFFGLCGPLNADDDNFITRWVVRKGYDVAIQSGPQATIETTLGEYPKFLNQCLR
jgi:Glycosyltransferase like family 2